MAEYAVSELNPEALYSCMPLYPRKITRRPSRKTAARPILVITGVRSRVFSSFVERAPFCIRVHLFCSE